VPRNQSPQERDAALVRDSWKMIERSRELLEVSARLVERVHSGKASEERVGPAVRDSCAERDS
jgi:hypothetical protein